MRVKLVLIFNGLTLGIIQIKQNWISQKNTRFSKLLKQIIENHNFVWVIDP